jgi:hypothetical protein
MRTEPQGTKARLNTNITNTALGKYEMAICLYATWGRAALRREKHGVFAQDKIMKPAETAIVKE